MHGSPDVAANAQAALPMVANACVARRPIVIGGVAGIVRDRRLAATAG